MAENLICLWSSHWLSSATAQAPANTLSPQSDCSSVFAWLKQGALSLSAHVETEACMALRAGVEQMGFVGTLSQIAGPVYRSFT